MKVVIVGGVAGGATAAARIRRLDENASIVVFEKTGYVSYANCGLPYYIGGSIKEEGRLLLQTPKSFKDRYNIDVHVHHEVTSIDRKRHVVTVKNLLTGETFEETYDKLLLSPGSKAILPPIEGINSKGVFVLKTVEDTFALKKYINDNKPRKALVVGGGFIGVETAENLKESGIDTVIVEKAKHILPQLDEDMVSLVENHIRAKGVGLVLGKGLSAIKPFEDEYRCYLDDGGHIRADLIIMSVGVRPNSELAKASGLWTDERGYMIVDRQMRTNDHDIYAIGDAVKVFNWTIGTWAPVALAGPANKQGRIAADNICGRNIHYNGANPTSVLKAFDLTVASTGVNDKKAHDLGYDYDSVILSPLDHASYYPGATGMTLKVTFSLRDGAILGAQCVGPKGVDKRIDVLATAMAGGMKAHELENLDLAYAPPYGSAKDPVNMASYMIGNILDGLVEQFDYKELCELPKDGSVILLDVRTNVERAAGYIEGSVHIPVDELRNRLGELDRSKKIYVHCQSGLRSYIACRMLEGHGYECLNYKGGYLMYASQKLSEDLDRDYLECGLHRH